MCVCPSAAVGFFFSSLSSARVVVSSVRFWGVAPRTVSLRIAHCIYPHTFAGTAVSSVRPLTSCVRVCWTRADRATSHHVRVRVHLHRGVADADDHLGAPHRAAHRARVHRPYRCVPPTRMRQLRPSQLTPYTLHLPPSFPSHYSVQA